MKPVELARPLAAVQNVGENTRALIVIEMTHQGAISVSKAGADFDHMTMSFILNHTLGNTIKYGPPQVIVTPDAALPPAEPLPAELPTLLVADQETAKTQ